MKNILRTKENSNSTIQKITKTVNACSLCSIQKFGTKTIIGPISAGITSNKMKTYNSGITTLEESGDQSPLLDTFQIQLNICQENVSTSTGLKLSF